MSAQTAPEADTVVSPSSIQAPSSTITPTHFQHKTQNAAPVNSLIDTATPAINTVPIELDSTPIDSPVKGDGGPSNLKSAIKGVVAGAEKKVAAVLDSSKLKADSAATMAGPPGTPGPEDFEAAKIDAAVTPS
jgi:hypothetical protein